MTDRYDALTVRESNGKSYWTKIGAAFPNRNGGGWTVMLDAMPASSDGQYKIMLREPKPREDRQQSGGQRTDSRGYADPADLDDNVPF